MKTTSRYALFAFALSVLPTGCQKDDQINGVQEEPLENLLLEQLTTLYGSVDELILPDSDDYLAIPNDPKNKLSEPKVALGKFLFHETELGLAPKSEIGTATYSCASCHHAKAGFQSGMKQGIGEGGLGFGLKGEERFANPLYQSTDIDVQPIRTPTILNTAYQDVMLWNGQFGATGTNIGTEANWTIGTPKAENNLGFEGVETQAIAGMGVHRLRLDPTLVENGPYKELFDAAFPNIAEEERYSIITAGLAISAFERTVLANEAPFQKFLKGNMQSMTDKEIEGALVFFGKGACYQCHDGGGLNGMDFHSLGMKDLSGTDIIGTVDQATAKGRGGFTKNPDDDYKFKTPTLYNLKDVDFMGHGGSFATIEEVIRYKNLAIAENGAVPTNRLSPLFKPLNLTPEEIEQLTIFIENALYDDRLSRYVPEQTPMGSSCFPNADEQSELDMGCN